MINCLLTSALIVYNIIIYFLYFSVEIITLKDLIELLSENRKRY